LKFEICPARDKCSKASIGDSGRYINIKDREALEAVLEKYGMTFPYTILPFTHTSHFPCFCAIYKKLPL